MQKGFFFQKTCLHSPSNLHVPTSTKAREHSIFSTHEKKSRTTTDNTPGIVTAFARLLNIANPVVSALKTPCSILIGVTQSVIVECFLFKPTSYLIALTGKDNQLTPSFKELSLYFARAIYELPFCLVPEDTLVEELFP